MKNLHGKGEELDSDIRDLLQDKIHADEFKRKYGAALFDIVNQQFLYVWVRILMLKDLDAAKEVMNSLSNKITMFSAAFTKPMNL